MIGWHFHYEGLWKVASASTEKPFSAEGYLRNSTGPFADYFRDLVPDVDGLLTLDATEFKGMLSEDVAGLSDHYGLNQEQLGQAKAALDESQLLVDEWFSNRDNLEKREKYVHDLESVRKVMANPNALATEKTWAWGQRSALEQGRKELTGELQARRDNLNEAILKIATPDQIASAGPYARPWNSLDWNNRLTSYGLVAIGFCMMLGLFTRFASLCGAVFLGLVYLAMPPWPGMPENPTDPGHYLFVDKNSVEMMACLALAALPTGHWVGLDAVLFGWLRRRREPAE